MKLIRFVVAAAAVATLAGCPGGGGVPGMVGSSTAPNTTGGAAACDRQDPSGTPITGGTKHGAYNGQRLPMGYDNLTDEAAVTAAIKKEDGGANWACFQKFYPGAVTVYQGKK